MFSEEVEACLRLKALSYIENKEKKDQYIGSAECCRFVRLYVMVTRASGLEASTRLKIFFYLMARVHNFLEDISLCGEYVAGVHRFTFEGMAVNINTAYVLSQSILRAVHVRGINTSQYCEYLFSSVQALSPSPTDAPCATTIDKLIGRATLSRILQLKIATKFSYRHARTPIYAQERLGDCEDDPSTLDGEFLMEVGVSRIPENHGVDKIKVTRYFRFPRKHRSGYQLINFAPVRNFHRIKLGPQYAQLVEATQKELA